MSSVIYPVGPIEVPGNLTRLSTSYKLRAILAILSILLFFLLYLGLVVLSGYLFYRMLMLPVTHVTIMTLLLKLGVIVGSGMLLFFTLKFLFKLKQPRRENRIEITREREPEVWGLVEQICREVDVPLPIAIYVDPDVNAYVSYTNFWVSLFYPVGKELTIGLGLVNSLNLGEFRAVIAHEFGHFSQRSMVIGSYIGTANTIIHDMIFTRDRWDEMLARWRSMDLRLSVVAWIITPMVWLIRQILRLFYSFLNIMHASLSREMEFNADKVAVSVAGSEAIISALWNLENRHELWTGTVSHAYLAAQKGLHTRNLYEHQSLARERRDQDYRDMRDGLPADDRGGRKYFADYEVSSVAMYMSHPPNDAREANAKTPFVPCDVDERSPWILFANPEQLQMEMTALVYEHYLERNPESFVGAEEFEQFVVAETAGGELSSSYGNTFGSRALQLPDDEAMQRAEVNQMAVDEAFAGLDHDISGLMERAKEIEGEMMKVQSIADRSSTEKTYTFNGITYRRKELAAAMEGLQRRHNELFEKEFAAWDTDFCALHLRLARMRGREEGLRNVYRQYGALIDIYQGIASGLNTIAEQITNLQNLDEVTQWDVNHVESVIKSRLLDLNAHIGALEGLPFLPLPNIDSVKELQDGIIEGGRFPIPDGPILEGDHLDRVVTALNRGAAHGRRLALKSLAHLLRMHDELREEFTGSGKNEE